MKNFWSLVLFLLVLHTIHEVAFSGIPAYPLDGRNPHFYMYGSVDGVSDSVVPRSDDSSSGEIPISTTFSFFGTPYTSVYVS